MTPNQCAPLGGAALLGCACSDQHSGVSGKRFSSHRRAHRRSHPRLRHRPAARAALGRAARRACAARAARRGWRLASLVRWLPDTRPKSEFPTEFHAAARCAACAIGRDCVCCGCPQHRERVALARPRPANGAGRTPGLRKQKERRIVREEKTKF